MNLIVSLCALTQFAVLFSPDPSTAAPTETTCWSCFKGRAEKLKGEFKKFVGLNGTSEPKLAFLMELLHVNDMHSRFEQTNRWSGVCTPWEAEHQMCVGGYGRVATVIKQAREAAQRNETPPVLVLNGGDNFQGSIYYTLFKAEVVTKFTNMLQFDALTLGNHEFDGRLEELEPYLRNIKSPIVAANVDISKASQFEGINLPPSVVVEVGEQKVGIIGYLTQETVTNDLEISDEITAVKKEAKRLMEQGIKIIIALGHSGFDVDKKVALEVPEIDVVVGAHSHTFLYNVTKHPLPDPQDKLKGNYPTIITQESGKKVPVVQAYAFTKYIGRLSLKFDENGEITSVVGNPLLLDNNIPEDKVFLDELDIWKEKVIYYTDKIIGSTLDLLANSDCRYRECNIGNVVADSLIYYRVKSMPKNENNSWTDASIALVFSGNIRNSIDARMKKNSVTYRDIIEALPFPNFIHLVKLKGEDLIEVLEHSVSEYDPTLTGNKARFLQVSGLQITYNIDKPSGHRVESVLARCAECDAPMYYPLQNDETYSVLMTSYMVSGGDGYSMIPSKGEITPLGNDATEMSALKMYFNNMSPIQTKVGSRIIIKNSAIAHHGYTCCILFYP